MWIATNIGFFSIVEKEHHIDLDGHKLFVVRARDKDDLIRLVDLIQPKIKEEIEIHSYDKSDYPHRIYLETKEDLATTLATLSETVTYPNFKDEISESPHQQRKTQAYSDLWLKLFMEYNPEMFNESV